MTTIKTIALAVTSTPHWLHAQLHACIRCLLSPVCPEQAYLSKRSNHGPRWRQLFTDENTTSLPSIVAQQREAQKDTNDKLDLILQALGQGGTLSGAKGASSSGGFGRKGNPDSNVDDVVVSSKGSSKEETVEIGDERDEKSSISRGKVAARLREQFDEVCVYTHMRACTLTHSHDHTRVNNLKRLISS